MGRKKRKKAHKRQNIRKRRNIRKRKKTKKDRQPASRFISGILSTMTSRLLLFFVGCTLLYCAQYFDSTWITAISFPSGLYFIAGSLFGLL